MRKRLRRSRLRATYALAAATLTLAVSFTANAGQFCGDDVDGLRVACGCGDIVVSDTTLRAGDPIAGERCAGDGLIVRAAVGAAGILLNLGGQSIIGGGSGYGIRVVRGGRDGAVIEGGTSGARAAIAGFRDGIRAAGRALAEVRSVDFNANTRDGVALWGMQVRLVDVGAEKNGRDGIHIGGREPRLEDARANANARYGIRITAANADVNGEVLDNRQGDVVANPRAHVEER